MNGKIFRGLAVLTLIFSVMIIALMVTEVSAQMPKKETMGGGHMGMSCPWEHGMTGPGKGMMGHGMGMGGQCMGMGCPGMGGPGVDVEVKKEKDGVTITYSSSDEKTARRLQLMGEMMKLKRELMELQSQ